MNQKRGSICICIGILLLSAALLLTIYNLWDANRAGLAAQSVQARLEAALPDTPPNLGTSAEREMPAVTVDGYRYVGVIEVPAENIKLPVMEECDMERLKIAPCRYFGSVYQNNMVIAGHNYSTHFSPLKWLSLGSEVIFTDAEGNQYHYTAATVESLQPTQAEALVTGDWDLTLFTCNTGGQTRCVIRCLRTDSLPLAEELQP